MKTNHIQLFEDSKVVFISKRYPITLSDSTPIKQQQKTKHMKTAFSLSAIIGRNTTNKRLLSVAEITDKPQFGSLLLNKALRSFVLLSIFVLMLQSLSWAQTTTLFLKNTATNPGTNANGNPNVYDLSATQGTTANTATTTGATSTAFIEILAFTITNSQLTAAISGDQFLVSFSVQSTQSNNMQYRYRLQRVNSSGIVVASTGYSSTVTGFTSGGPVVTTATLNFSTAQTWASTDRLRLSIEDSNTSSNTVRTMTVNTNNSNSYVRYTSCVAPSITTHPGNQNVNLGGSATFTVNAAGAGLTYQWRKGTNNIIGATSASYTISPVGAGDAATNYNVVITGTCGTVTSNNATLSLNPQPSASVTGQTNLTCFGVPGGSITIQASGGSGTGYTFSVDNGATYIGSGNPYTVTGLNANTAYKIRVKDSAGSQSPAIP